MRKERKGITGLTNSKNLEMNTSTKPSEERKVFSPQLPNSQAKGLSAKATKSSEKLFDRYIPCRVTQNLQAKFDAVIGQAEEKEVGLLLEEEDVSQDIPEGQAQKEEKHKNELYANLLASSLFLDEEEEAKEE